MKHSQGFILLTVTVLLLVLATLAFLPTRQGSMGVEATASQADIAAVEHITNAGMEHNKWYVNNYACAGDTSGSVPFGAHSYATSITAGGTTSAYTLSVDQDAWIRSDNTTSNNGTNIDQHIKFEAGKIEHTMYRFDLSALPAAAQINSATVWLYIESTKGHPEGPLTVHRVNTDWTETGATWDNMNGNFDAQVLATIPAQDQAGAVWVSFNITSPVQAWVNGDPNYGILLQSTAEGVHAEHVSKEGTASQHPRLEVVVGTTAASPATLQSTGTHSTGISRVLTRTAVPAYQPGSFTILQPGSEGKDAEIWLQQPNNNYGTADEAWVSRNGTDITLSLLEFNMGTVPAAARILSATLSLYHRSGSGSDVPVTAHRVTNPWTEDFVTWNSRDNGTNWDSAGGDFDSTVIATTDVGPASSTRYEWDITSLAQGWIDGVYPNHGVVLTTALTGAVGERFDTSDHSDAARRPSLTIVYACECGTVCIAPQGAGNILMVVADPAALEPFDITYIEKFESWGYTVNTINDSDSQSNFDTAMAANDVVYVTRSSLSGQVGNKLTSAPIGIVNEKAALVDELGIASGNNTVVTDDVQVVDNSHFITEIFPAGTLSIYSADMRARTITGPAPGAQILADYSGAGTVVALDEGATTVGGGPASSRRVMLPFTPSSTFNSAYVNNNGWLIVQRAIAWAMNSGATSTNLLMVVVDPANLTVAESARKSLVESWGYTVTLIDEADTQTTFDTAVAANDVVYVSETIIADTVNTKLTAATIGVVYEEYRLDNDLGLATSSASWLESDIVITDNTHYITQPFATGALTLFTSAQDATYLSGTLASGLQTLGTFQGDPALAVVDQGEALLSGTAAGRRVQLPWGESGLFDFNTLTTDGQTILKRALEWGASIPPPPGAANIILSTETDATLGGLNFSDIDLVEYDTDTDTASLYFDGSLTTLDRDIDAVHVLANDHIVLSPKGDATLGGLSFEDGDLVDYDPATDTSILIFDGSALFTDPSENIISVHVLDNGHIVLSTDSPAILGGLSFDDIDLVEYDLGTDTAALFLNGSLTSLNADIDAVYVLANGHIVLSTKDASTLGGLSFADGDLVDYDPATDTSVLYFDEGLFSGDEDITSAHIGPGSGTVSGGGSINVTVAVGDDDAEQLTSDGTMYVTSSDLELADNLGSTGTPTDIVGIRFVNVMVPQGETITNAYIQFQADETDSGKASLTIEGEAVDDAAQFTSAGYNITSRPRTSASVEWTPPEWTTVGERGPDQRTVNIAAVIQEIVDRPGWSSGQAMAFIISGTGTRTAESFEGDPAGAPELHIEYGAGGGGSSYIEMYEPWSASVDNNWEVIDLNTFGVPADAVVEVAIINTNTGKERRGGVRAMGSTLDRRFRLHEAESGGVDAVVMHVQADGSGRIQHYAELKAEVKFTLLGYWTGASYVERFDTFTATDSSWKNRNLAPFGVSANNVAEIVMANTNTSSERFAGVRAAGSSFDRQVTIHEAESGGIDAVTMFVTADGSSNATIQVRDEAPGDVDFYLVGYWSTPPGTYVETGGIGGSADVGGTWQQVKPGNWGGTSKFGSAIVALQRGRFCRAKHGCSRSRLKSGSCYRSPGGRIRWCRHGKHARQYQCRYANGNLFRIGWNGSQVLSPRLVGTDTLTNQIRGSQFQLKIWPFLPINL